MSKYKTVLFDLDGTLIDSSPGITTSAAYAMKKVLGRIEDPATLKCFIGPPLREQFMNFCGVDLETGTKLVSAYREYYSAGGLFECSLYDGVPELLDNLRNDGCSILLATIKPEVFAKRILEHFSIDSKFDYIAGSNLDNTRTVKYEVICYALENAPEHCCIEPSKCVMVGDSPHDITHANKAGVDGIAALYGFSEKKLLDEVPAVAQCYNTKEIYEYIKSAK